MFAWILTLWANPLARRIILYGAGLLAIFYAARLWGNVQWSRGEQQGRAAGALEMEKAKRQEWATRETQIAKDAAAIIDQEKALAADRLAVAARSADLERIWQASRATLAQVVTAAKTKQETKDAQVDAIPPSALLDALRARSAELAAQPIKR